MDKKFFAGLFILSLSGIFVSSSVSFAIEAKDLANICQNMEKAINDISIEYEWFHIPPMTVNDANDENFYVWITPWKQSLTSKKPFNRHYLFIEKFTAMNKKGCSFEDFRKISYNNKVSKFFSSAPSCSNSISMNGAIAKGEKFMTGIAATPIGFSVFRFAYDGEKMPLSKLLREKDIVKVDNNIVKINDFNAIRADIFTAWKWKNEHLLIYKIYFAVDYGYTPIRYEYMTGPKVTGTIDVNSLQEVQKKLWLPSSGLITSSDPNHRTNGFRVIGKIRVNRGLKDKDFDIEFPPGTWVNDEIAGKMYTIKPAQEQVDKSLPK
jgi:hypothetical protein